VSYAITFLLTFPGVNGTAVRESALGDSLLRGAAADLASLILADSQGLYVSNLRNAADGVTTTLAAPVAIQAVPHPALDFAVAAGVSAPIRRAAAAGVALPARRSLAASDSVSLTVTYSISAWPPLAPGSSPTRAANSPSYASSGDAATDALIITAVNRVVRGYAPGSTSYFAASALALSSPAHCALAGIAPCPMGLSATAVTLDAVTVLRISAAAAAVATAGSGASSSSSSSSASNSMVAAIAGGVAGGITVLLFAGCVALKARASASRRTAVTLTGLAAPPASHPPPGAKALLAAPVPFVRPAPADYSLAGVESGSEGLHD
jgi:hypothetical protein